MSERSKNGQNWFRMFTNIKINLTVYIGPVEALIDKKKKKFKFFFPKLDSHACVTYA